MTFLDEEVRDAFHKIGTTMQIICSILEYECAKYHQQIELIGCEEDHSLLVAKDMPDSEMNAVCDHINRQFKRKDKRLTCVVHDQTLKLFKCFVTHHSDFEEMH